MNTKSIVAGIFWAALAARLFQPTAEAQTPNQTAADFEKYALELRVKALLKLQPQVTIPTANRPLSRPKYPWKKNIVTALIWVGSEGPKSASAWDSQWAMNFGGVDLPDPHTRRGFISAAFVPQLNPFYCALPYNDVTREATKPEAREVIPWYNEAFEKEGQSVCRDRWVRIRNRGGKDCYAQWSDCGPFRADHWQYVFGDERPKPNRGKGAGISIGPAVRDYLGLGGTDVVDWQFVDVRDIPRGPWSMYGENNHFVQMARRSHRQTSDLKVDPQTSTDTIAVPKKDAETTEPTR